MGKVAIVTGGSRGIGSAIVKKLVENGIKVAFSYHTGEEKALELVKQLNADGKLNCIAEACDVRNFDSVKAFVKKAVSVFGFPVILVNNAGIANYKLMIDLNPNEWRNIMATNLDGVYYACHECLPYMLDKGGSIVNISSVWGVYGASSEVAYSASKAGIIGLTKALAQEYGRSNIRVNCVAPGVINTDMNKCHSKEVMEGLCDCTPLARVGEAEEVANTVLFLVEDASSFITGQTIEVTGGFKG